MTLTVSPSASGFLTFTPAMTPPAAKFVRYLINGAPAVSDGDEVPLDRPVSELTWHSRNLYDGEAAVQAVALDVDRNQIDSSPVVPFTVNNNGVTLKVLTDYGRPLSGVIEWKVQTNYELQPLPPTGKEAYGWQFAIDGFVQPWGWDRVNPKSWQLDTTKLSNGEHEISVVLRISQAGGSNKAVAQSQVRIKTDNGVLAPVWSATFDPNTTLPSNEFPHFTRTGKIVSEFGNDSFFPRGMFALTPNAILRPKTYPTTLSDEIKKARINTVESGIYPNPEPRPNQSDTEWQASADRLHNEIKAACVPLGLAIHATGDDVCRTSLYLANTINDPRATQRIRYCLSAAKSMMVWGIAMCDEVNNGGMWGPTPFQTKGAWLKKTPPIPDMAFVKVFEILNTPDRPPISWPVVAGSTVQSEKDWNQAAEYREIYWSVVSGYPLYAGSASTAQLIRDGMDRSVLGRAAAREGIPFLLQIGCNGPSYQKHGTSIQFDTETDTLLGPGHLPDQITAQMLIGIARGAAGFRIYSFETVIDEDDKKGAPGDRQRFTGTNPWTVGKARWDAMSSGFGLIAELEPLILQPNDVAPDLGPNFIAGVKRGPAGAMLIVVNISSVPQSALINIEKYPGKTTQIRSLGAKVSRSEYGGGTVVVQSGESVIWTFTPTAVPVDPCQGVIDELAATKASLSVAVLEADGLKIQLQDAALKLSEAEADLDLERRNSARRLSAFILFSEEMNH